MLLDGRWRFFSRATIARAANSLLKSVALSRLIEQWFRPIVGCTANYADEQTKAACHHKKS